MTENKPVHLAKNIKDDVQENIFLARWNVIHLHIISLWTNESVVIRTSEER